MAIPQTFISELRERTDMLSLVGAYVRLRRSGRGYVGLCPFHTEKTPSFTVYPDSASFYCYGCHKGGDAITFVRDIENLDYVAAVRTLAERAGMTMPDEGAYDGLARTKRRLKEMHRDAARFFYSRLSSPDGREALDYLHQRGVSDRAITHFGVGWAPAGWQELTDHLLSKGYRADEIILGNLAFEGRSGRPTDRFRERIMFPIIDVQGSVIAFGGRTMKPKEEGKPYRKYLNTSDTPIYKKSRNLYGINWAKNTNVRRDGERVIIVVEGFMDVIALWQAGIDNAVAAQGTAFTKEQAQLLAKYSKKIVLSQDGDAAGQRAIKASIPVLRSSGIDVSIITVPEGLDPDEYIRKYGPERMKDLVSGGVSDTEYLLGEARGKTDDDTPRGRVEYLERVCDVLETLSPIERDVYAGRVAEELGVEKSAILSQLSERDRKKNGARQREEIENMRRVITGSADRLDPTRAANTRAAKAEETLLAMLLEHPERVTLAKGVITPEQFVTGFNRKLYGLLIELCESGESPSLMLMSSRLTPEEMASAARVFNAGGAPPPDDDKTIQTCADIILDEGRRLTGDALAEASPEELLRRMEELRKKKKRGRP